MTLVKQLIMEDFWGLLIVFGIIVFKVIQESKKKKALEEIDEQPAMPEEEVIVYEVPEEEVVITQLQKRKKKNSHKLKTEKVVLPEEAPRTTVSSPLQTIEPHDDAQTIDIDDVKRGIIWSEILNRKY